MRKTLDPPLAPATTMTMFTVERLATKEILCPVKFNYPNVGMPYFRISPMGRKSFRVDFDPAIWRDEEWGPMFILNELIHRHRLDQVAEVMES